MGEPFLPPWECGYGECERCDHLFEGQCTPVHMYASVQDVERCPGVPPDFPDPNGVFRLLQNLIDPCLWELNVNHGLIAYYYYFWWHQNGSDFGIGAFPPPLQIFNQRIAMNCQTFFSNQTQCPPLGVAIFHNGQCQITWGF